VVQAGAKCSLFAGFHNGAVKLKVAAPPAEGAANEEIVDFLSSLFSIKKRDVIIEQGTLSKIKVIFLNGVTPDVIIGKWGRP